MRKHWSCFSFLHKIETEGGMVVKVDLFALQLFETIGFKYIPDHSFVVFIYPVFSAPANSSRREIIVQRLDNLTFDPRNLIIEKSVKFIKNSRSLERLSCLSNSLGQYFRVLGYFHLFICIKYSIAPEKAVRPLMKGRYLNMKPFN